MYTPTVYLMNGHLQTLYYNVLNPGTKVIDPYVYDRSLVQLPDGGQIAIDVVKNPESQSQMRFTPSTPIVVLLPGLTGDRYCGYAKALTKEINNRHYQCVVLNHRGCSQTALTSRM